MPINCLPEIKQDSSAKRIIISDSVIAGATTSDSVKITVSDSVKPAARKQIKSIQELNTDTVSVCERNPVSDVTYWRPWDIIETYGSIPETIFPFQFIDKNQKLSFRRRESLEKHLRQGDKLPETKYHYDWNIIVLILSIALFSAARSATKSFIPGFARFYLFRGTGDEGNREVLGIFQWKSTILNLAAFLVLALFSFFSAQYLQLLPEGVPEIIIWLILFAGIVFAITIRHITCYITGIFSGQEAAFTDYLHTIYQSYRFSALIIFFLSVMISYTGILPEKLLISAGAIVFSVHYLIRIFRLLLIFIKRNISIFYLILYLCALEILPVLIVIRFFSGLGY